MIPQNQEHLEALQQETNAIKTQIISNLSEEAAKKLAIVEECCQKLVDNKILFYLFPSIADRNGIARTWQYNSTINLCEFDNSGRSTEESDKKLSAFNSGVFEVMFRTCTLRHTELTLEQKFYLFCAELWKVLNK